MAARSLGRSAGGTLLSVYLPLMLRDAEDGYPWPPRRDWYPAELALAAGENDRRSLVEAIRARVAPLGGVELHIPPREAIRTVPELDE